MTTIPLTDGQIKKYVDSNRWGRYIMHTVTPVHNMLVYEIWTYSKKNKEYATRFLVLKQNKVVAYDEFSAFALTNLPNYNQLYQVLLFAFAELAVIGLAWQTHDYYLYTVIGAIISAGVTSFFKRN